MHRNRRCLFCGDLASDTRLVDKLSQLMCVECFDHTRQVFSLRGDIPLFVNFARCIVCGCSARSRLLVAGVAAAICRECHLAVKRGSAFAKIDQSRYPLRGGRLRALQRSRAARRRTRREHERLEKTISSLQPEELATRGMLLLGREGQARYRMRSHLALVTSRDQVRGRPALKIGKRPGTYEERGRAA